MLAWASLSPTDRTDAIAKRQLRLTEPALHRARLPNSFRTPELLPLGSRIRARLELSALSPQELAAYLDFMLQKAGAPQLIAQELIQTLAAHAHGNLRVLTHMAAELLSAAAERNLPRIDEALYFDLFSPPVRQSRRS